MLVLFETPAGFALFKVLDEAKLSKVDVRALYSYNFSGTFSVSSVPPIDGWIMIVSGPVEGV